MPDDFCQTIQAGFRSQMTAAQRGGLNTTMQKIMSSSSINLHRIGSIANLVTPIGNLSYHPGCCSHQHFSTNGNPMCMTHCLLHKLMQCKMPNKVLNLAPSVA
jgi:hypothetical protein